MATQHFTPTFRQLRAFLSVYRLGKISAAADQLFITQSAVSMLIRQLEDGLNQRLFDRTTRALAVTPAGKEAAIMAERILRDVDAMGGAFGELQDLRRGRVSFAITPTLAGMLLPKALEQFSQDYPNVQVVIDDCGPEQFSSRVLAEHVDFGVGTPERAGGQLQLQTLMRDQLCLICPADHTLAGKAQLRWQDLQGQRVIVGRPGYGARAAVDAACVQAGVQLHIAHEISFLSMGLWMVASGVAPAIMPSAYASYWPLAQQQGLVIQALQAPNISRDISIVTKLGRSLPRACEVFVQTLRQSLQTQPPQGITYFEII